MSIGVKKIARSWETKYRGPLAIHAANKKPNQYISDFMFKLVELNLTEIIPAKIMGKGTSIDITMPRMKVNVPFGSVVAICSLVDCVPITPEFVATLSENERAFGLTA
ncbi:hypothetical protein [Desulfotomaculum sp. 1211_IL3151]|uniref:hypothetical protein n=1 Tax=Desulfotomaculum sp. 1211_IL3151 TaxID=3084055 RepID=UPI002FD8EDC2